MDDVPPEMTAAILGFLVPVDRFVCALVSATWRAIIEANTTLNRATDWWDPCARPWARRTFLAEASLRGRLDLLKWAVAEGCPWDDDACAAALAGGHAHVFAWLCDAGCPWTVDRCLVGAATGGLTDIVRAFLREQRQQRERPRPRWHESAKRYDASQEASRISLDRAVHQAARGDHRDVLDLFLTNVRTCVSTIWEGAAAVGNVGLFGWLCDRGYAITCSVSAHAASHGHIGALEWLRERNEMSQWDACLGASAKGHDHVIDWLPTLCPRNAYERMILIMIAARHGRVDTVGHLLDENGWFYGMRMLQAEAAHHGHLDVLKHVKDRGGTRMYKAITLAAAHSGHTHVLTWALSVGIRMSRLVTAVAAVHGHHETAQFCREECGIGMLWEFTEPIWQGYAPNSFHKDPFTFGPRRHALDMALAHGGPASAERLSRYLPAHVPTTKGAFRLVLDTHDPRVVVPLLRYADDFQRERAWKEAASRCDLGMTVRLHDAYGLPGESALQRMFGEAACSEYGWRPVCEWLASKDARCMAYTVKYLEQEARRAHDQAVAWAADHCIDGPRNLSVSDYVARP